MKDGEKKPLMVQAYAKDLVALEKLHPGVPLSRIARTIIHDYVERRQKAVAMKGQVAR